MAKSKRPAIVRERVEKLLAKYERRIQRLAAESYELRMVLERIDEIEAKKKAEAAPQETGQVAGV